MYGNSVKLKTITVRNCFDLKAIKDALLQLSKDDCDFSGENGIEYVLPEAIKKGYESNAEYYADLVLSNNITDTNDKEKAFSEILNAIKHYLEHFMSSDTEYYEDYECEITRVGFWAIIISLAYTYPRS